MKVFSLSLALFLLLACSKPEEDTESREAASLFQETVSLISDYTIKVKNSNDSNEIDNLMVEFDKKLTDINFSYPSNTDLNLTEQDNDSIFKLMKNLKETRRLTLSRIHQDYLNSISTEEE